MASAKGNFFGLELLRKTVESDIKRKEDFLVILFHWLLQSEQFRCIGTGDAREVSGDEEQTELLPPGWNAMETYLLRYVKDGKLYLIRISKTGEDIIFNFIRSEDMKIASIVIPTSDVNDEDVVDKSAMLKKFEKELLEPFRPAPKPENRPNPNPLQIGPRRGPLAQSTSTDERGYPRGFPQYGRSDLDPFASTFQPGGMPMPGGMPGIGGGMLFPMPGARQPFFPGVRFDPTNPEQGPLGPRGGRGWGHDPDPDNLPPPGMGGYFM